MTQANVKYRKDYQPSNFLIKNTALTFQLHDDYTLVTSQLSLERNTQVSSSDNKLVLSGEELQLESVEVDGKSTDYEVNDEHMMITDLPDQCELTIVTRINPAQNTSLEGLYLSSGKYCTQCEAEGFRKITYYLDRPDVMSLYQTRIEADKAKFPYLLSNGNQIDRGDLQDGRHFAVWQDPFPKPSYLFALVAGDFDLLKDQYRTQSGRDVALEIYVDKGKLDQCHHAMHSLKRSMQWDEQRFGLEYDLDTYMIVAVGDFNMGAMENKGLNVFNTKYVLANDHTATDKDFIDVEAVIGHEYFHNWTGNRVTCRDWFQLSLKEGLTVFRDQEFTSDLHDRDVKRIEDVKVLRSHQFPEDAGPMAHPVRPDSYIEMNNFYTVTVYNKGAEVIRMMHTILGESNFQKGMRLYFERHDGSAVTCEDFVRAMEDASGVSLMEFRAWYRQAGTPQVSIISRYDEQTQQLTIDLQQTVSEAANKSLQKPLAPFHIPLKFALLDQEGQTIEVKTIEGVEYSENCIHLKSERAQAVIPQVTSEPKLSWLRDFSAPIKIDTGQSLQDLLFLMAHDSNAFNRWESSQRVMQQLILYPEDTQDAKQYFVNAFKATLLNEHLGAAFRGLMLRLPEINYLMELTEKVDIEHLCRVRDELEIDIARLLQNDFLDMYHALSKRITTAHTDEARGLRALKNTCLHYLALTDDAQVQQLCQTAWQQRQNMTDSVALLNALNRSGWEQMNQQAFKEFEQQWQHEPLVMDKWFSLQAIKPDESSLEWVQQLTQHELFSYTNPNRVRSLVSTFAQLNPYGFHIKDGSGYRWVGEQVKKLDGINPQVAARIVSAFNRWRLFDETRQLQMKSVLESILAEESLSKDVYEIASKALA